jgi:hypothetical protein
MCQSWANDYLLFVGAGGTSLGRKKKIEGKKGRGKKDRGKEGRRKKS